MHFQQAQDDFLLYLEDEQNYSPHTIVGYEYDLNRYCDFIEKHGRSTELDALNPLLTRRFIQDQVKNLEIKPRTIHRRISSLKSFSKFCLKNQYMKDDFMAGVVPPKTDTKIPTYMTLEELKQLFQFLETDAHPLALRNHTMFRLLATTGMRRQELCNLKWNNVDFLQGTVKVLGKGQKERLLPLHRSVIPLLKKLHDSMKEHQRYSDEPVFLNNRGISLNPRGLHKMFKLALEKTGLPPQRFTLHHLRHTFATLLIQGTSRNLDSIEIQPGKAIITEPFMQVDLRTVQELLGHASLSTTQVYTNVNFEQKKKAIDSFKF